MLNNIVTKRQGTSYILNFEFNNSQNLLTNLTISLNQLNMLHLATQLLSSSCILDSYEADKNELTT